MSQQKLLGLLAVLIILLITPLPGPAYCQERYPTRAIEIIVPFGAGGGVDIPHRILASFLTKKWGVPVNVVNKPGGNNIPANLDLYSAKPDGYTLLADGLHTSLMGVATKNLPFKIMDRTFVAMTHAGGGQIMSVSNTSPIKSLKELEAAIKKGPEKFTWTSMGGVSSTDFNIRQFLKAINVDVLKTKPVMAKGGAEIIALVAGGHVVLGSAGSSTSISAIKGKLVRPLAIAGENRMQELPDLPTAMELGYPTVKTMHWMGYSAPPKLPSHIIDKWEKTLPEILKDAEVVAKLQENGNISFYHNAQETREYVMKEIEEINKLYTLQ